MAGADQGLVQVVYCDWMSAHQIVLEEGVLESPRYGLDNELLVLRSKEGRAAEAHVTCEGISLEQPRLAIHWKVYPWGPRFSGSCLEHQSSRGIRLRRYAICP